MLVVLFLLGAVLTSSSPAPVSLVDTPVTQENATLFIRESWRGQNNNQPLRSICYIFTRNEYTNGTKNCYEFEPDYNYCVTLNITFNAAETTRISDANCYNETTFTKYADAKWGVVLNNFQNSVITTTPKAAAGLSISLLTVLISTMVVSRQ